MTTQRDPTHTRIPASVCALGMVSMLMDISSEMIHRDALVADITPPEIRGAAFSPRQPLCVPSRRGWPSSGCPLSWWR